MIISFNEVGMNQLFKLRDCKSLMIEWFHHWIDFRLEFSITFYKSFRNWLLSVSFKKCYGNGISTAILCWFQNWWQKCQLKDLSKSEEIGPKNGTIGRGEDLSEPTERSWLMRNAQSKIQWISHESNAKRSKRVIEMMLPVLLHVNRW